MTTPINKTTPSAREILEDALYSTGRFTTDECTSLAEALLIPVGEIAQLSWEAGVERGVDECSHIKTGAERTTPDKETFITNLML